MMGGEKYEDVKEQVVVWSLAHHLSNNALLWYGHVWLYDKCSQMVSSYSLTLLLFGAEKVHGRFTFCLTGNDCCICVLMLLEAVKM